MFRLLAQFLVAWGLWKYIEGRIGQYVFGITSLAFIWYFAGEAEKYLLLTGQTKLLPELLIVKNIGYVFALTLFVAWPFFLNRPKELNDASPSVDKGDPVSRNSSDLPNGDEFDRIRQRGKTRSASEIQLDRLKEKRTNGRK